MDFKVDSNAGVRLAAALARDADAGPSVQSATAILEEFGVRLDEPISADQVEHIQKTSIRLRAVFESASTEEVQGLIAGLLGDVNVDPHLGTHGGRSPHLHFAVGTEPLPHRVASNAVMGVAIAFNEEGLESLKAAFADDQ